MGVHPIKVFEKRNKTIKNKISNQFIDIVERNQVTIPEIRLKKLNENNNIIGTNKKIIYFDSYLDENDEFFILDNSFIGQKIDIQESKESDKIFYVKENTLYKEFPIKDNINKNIQNKLIIKSIFKNKYFILAGYFDGSLYVIKTPNKLSKKEEAQKADNPYYYNNEKIIKKFDKSVITSLEVDKREKYLIYGTMNGSIVIYYLNYNSFKENKSFIEFKKIFKSHNGYPISSISINSDLNIFADCSIDGYVNVYNLSSYYNFKKINSIYINQPFVPNFVFISAQPLPSIALYSNELCQFKCFSLNGNELNTKENDTKIMSNKFNEYYVENEQNMISPIIFTDSLFNDYLIYIFKKKYVLIREFPSMKIKIPFNPTMDSHNQELCSLSISDDKKYLYVLEQKSNKIYMINQKFFNNNSK
jgi:WD40 repeat protein